MPGYQDYFDMYSGRIPGERQQALSDAARQREEELRRITTRPEANRIAAEDAAGVGMDSSTEMEQDMRRLTTLQLEQKYGPEVAAQMNLARVRGTNASSNDAMLADDRSWMEVGVDAASSAAQAAIGGLGGIAAWGLGEIDPEAGAIAARVNNAFSDFLAIPQSEGLAANRRIVGAEANAARRENERQFQESDGDFWDVVQREAENFLDVGAAVLANPGATGDVAAQAAGSLASGATLAKGLRTIGAKVMARAGTGAAATRVAAAGRTASVPLAIGLQEGGGAYTETITEAYALLADRTDLTEEQKTELANAAAVTAARLQAPIGVVTGMIVAKFERNPLANVSARQAAENIAREVVEESIQSGSAGIASNFALGQDVDPGRELSGGVGEDVAYGAIGGLGAAGGVQIPGVVAQTGRDAVVGGAQAIARPIIARGERLAEQARAASPFSRESLAGAFASAVSTVSPIIEQAKAKLNEMDVPQDVRDRVNEYTDRVMNTVSNFSFADVSELTDIIKDTASSAHERMAAAMTLKDITDKNVSLVEQQGEALDGIEVENINEINDLLTSVTQNPEVSEALDQVSSIAAETTITVDEVTDPTNKMAIAAALGVAQFAPEKADPAVNDVILKHADEGKINLTPIHRAALQTSKTLAEVEEDHATVQADLVKVNKQAVSQVVLEEGADNLRNIVDAMRRGDVNGARARLEDFAMFATLFQNKLNALNAHAKIGTGNKTDAVPYQNLVGDPGTRRWREAATGMWVNANVPKTVAFARSVENDARALTTLVNNLATIFPELGIEKLPEDIALDLSPEAPLVGLAGASPEVDGPAVGDTSPVAPETAEVAQPKAEAEPEAVEERQDNTDVYISEEDAKLMSKNALQEVFDNLVRRGFSDLSRDEKATYKIIKDELENRIDNETPVAAETAQPEGGDTSTEVKVEDNRAEEIISETAEQITSEETQQVEPEADSTPARAEPDQSAEADQITDTPEGVTPSEPVKEKSFTKLFGGWFLKAFKISDEPKTRTFGNATPVATILAALKSSTTLSQFMGKELRHDYSPELAATYVGYIQDEAKGLANALQAQLDEFLDKKTYGGIRGHVVEGTTPTSSKGNPVELAQMVNGKALNLVEVSDDGQVTYNSELMGGAILAGLQWMLNVERYWAPLDQEAVAKIFGLELGNSSLEDITVEMNKGLGVIEVKRSLATQIVRYWGVSSNNSTDLAAVEGIAEAMAGEMIRAMVTQKLLDEVTIRVTEQDGLPVPDDKTQAVKEINRYIPLIGKTDALKQFPTAIEEAVMVDPEINFIGMAPQKVAETQMNNRRAKNTKDGKAALAHENSTPYRLNVPMVEFFDALDEQGISFLFGGGDLTNRRINQNTRKTLEGRNITMLGAYRTLKGLVAEVTNLSKSEGKPIDEMDVFFEHNFSSIGRMQQLGRNSPQASKLMREALLPTWSTLDLSDESSSNFKWFGLALAQALGVKVHTQSIEASLDQVFDMLGGGLEGETAPMAEAVTMLRSWLNSKSKTLTDDQITLVAQALGSENTPLAFHAMLEYARFLNAQDKSSFKTALYIEADGVTNGPVNAMGMLTPGQFTPQWIENMAKGGLFLDDQSMTMNTHRSEVDSNDLYQTMAGHLSANLSELYHQLHMSGADQLRDHLNNLMSIMSMLKPKDFNKVDRGEWLVSRSVTKNPLTITLYGSGENGIAGNILEELTAAVYQKLSDANELMLQDSNLTLAEAMFGDQATEKFPAEKLLAVFENRLNSLMSTEISVRKDELMYRPSGVAGIKLQSINREKFTFAKDQIDNMRSAVRYLFVEPMTEAINTTVGREVIDALTNLRKATQVQSIFYEAAFKREIERALSKKEEGEFLSQKEIDDILDRLSYLAPTIETGKQRFDIAGSQKSDVPLKEFGRALNDQMRTDAFIFGPTNSGVSGIPTMVVGMGDGYMQQWWATLQNSVSGTLKIFDGTNLPLDQIEKGSEQANQAAFESWMGNPLQMVSDSFSRFLKDAPVSEFSDEQIEALGRALFTPAEQRNGVTVKMITDAMTVIEAQLKDQALTVEARHQVLREVNVAVDQMASTGVTYRKTDGLDLTGLSPRDAALALNKLYREKLNKLRSESQVNQNIGSDLEQVGVEHSSGARVISSNDLKHLVANAKISAEQKTILNDVIQSMKADGYQIVVGVPWRLQEFAETEGLSSFEITEHDHGLTIPGDKTIYITSRNPTAETLVHELLHAATFEAVLGHYNKNTTVNRVAIAQAVERIEAMMEQFLGMEDQLSEVSPAALNAYQNAVIAIRSWQNRANQSEAVRKAGALNEFMAWSLSNQDLVRTQKRTTVAPLAKMIRTVVEGIKQLIWGKKSLAPKVWQDMHSNLRFNTQVIMNAEPSVQSLLNGIVLFQSTGASSKSDQLAKIETVFREKIIQYLDVELEEQTERDARFNEAFVLATNTANTMTAHGFPMKPDALRAFHSVVAALATQAELDPNALVEAQRIYAHVTKVLKPSDFMEDPASTNPNDLALAQDRYDVVIGNYSRGKDTQSRTAMLSSFLALSMVNEDFRKALAKIEMPKRQLGKWNTMDGFLENVGIVVMDELASTMSGGKRSAPNVAVAMNALSHRLIQVAQTEQENLLSQSLNLVSEGVSKVNDVVVSTLSTLSDGAIGLADAGLQRTNNKVARTLLEGMKMTAALVDEDNAGAVAQGWMSQVNKSKLPKWTSELMNEFIGRTDENAPVYDMIKLVRSWVQQSRQMFRERLPEIIASKFTSEVSDEQWTQMFNATAKTDLAALVANRGYTVNEVMDLIKDPSKIAAEISRIEAKLQTVDASKFVVWQRKGKELAEFMVTGKVPQNLLRNAGAIAQLYGEIAPGKDVSPEQLAQVTPDLDTLISLYAYEITPAETKAALTSLAQNEADGLSFTLSYLLGQRRSELGKPTSANDLAVANHYKGYIPSESKTGMSLVVAPAKDEIKMRHLGYEKMQDYVGSKVEPNTVKRSYYFSPVSGKAMYSQGILQNVRATYSGVDPLTGFTNHGMTASQITDMAAVKRIARIMHLNKDQGEALLPIYNIDGQIIAFERSVDPVMDSKLDRNTHLGKAIGMWRGRQAEEHQANVFNNMLITKLADRWDIDRATRSDEYVNVFDPKELKKDPVLNDSISLLNSNTRAAIKAAFGKDAFWVRRDMLNDALGYRAATASDLWTGNSRWPEPMQRNIRNLITGIIGADALKKVVTAEQFIQNFVTDARVTIVVKSVIVPTANLLSNMFQLLSRGVGIGDIFKGMPKKTAEINEFVKGRVRRIELEAELRAAGGDPAKSRRLQTEIQTILDANRRMSIWPLIQAGEFASISDTGISQEEILLAEGRLSAYMEKLTSKLPDSLKTLGRYGIISKDTALYKGLQRVVEYGDFLGKAVLYDHLTKKKGLSQAEALARITEEFVNYDRLAGRSRTYLENMGLLWFWNFKIRSTKVALSIIRNNPVHALFALSGPVAADLASVGSPITDNAVAVTLDGRSGWSMGPNMAIHAHMLNPWFNAVT